MTDPVEDRDRMPLKVTVWDWKGSFFGSAFLQSWGSEFKANTRGKIARPCVMLVISVLGRLRQEDP